MEHQAEAPEHGPDVVTVAVVGQLMLENMAPDLLALGRLGRQVDGRPEHTEDAGRRDRLRHVDRKQTLRHIQRPAPPLELQGQMDIARDDHRGHHHHPGKPEVIQKPAQIQLHDRFCLLLGGLFDDHGINMPVGSFVLGRRLPVGGGILPLVAVLIGRYIDLPDRLGDIHLICDGGGAEIAGEELEGHQQPHQHHRPEGILEPQADFSPEQEPAQEHRRNQN